MAFSEAWEHLTLQHQQALAWFQANRGKVLPWTTLKAQADVGTRLVNQAKGIYKPAYTDYALSVRTLMEGPYPDKDVEFRADGSWICEYFQENQDPAKRDREMTNRGLVKCMNDRVPVGFLVKCKPKPGVEYRVLGLGYVVDWSNGYFTIEGLREDEVFPNEREGARSRATLGAPIDSSAFDASDEADARERAISEIAIRRGQAAFRANLLVAYGGRCCVTGCDLPDALEAAHIMPYRGSQTNHPQNGLLLRSDIHALFDLGLIAVGEDGRLVVHSRLLASEAYRDLSGRALTLPQDPKFFPSRDALLRHRLWAGL